MWAVGRVYSMYGRNNTRELILMRAARERERAREACCAPERARACRVNKRERERERAHTTRERVQYIVWYVVAVVCCVCVERVASENVNLAER